MPTTLLGDAERAVEVAEDVRTSCWSAWKGSRLEPPPRPGAARPRPRRAGGLNEVDLRKILAALESGDDDDEGDGEPVPLWSSRPLPRDAERA